MISRPSYSCHTITYIVYKCVQIARNLLCVVCTQSQEIDLPSDMVKRCSIDIFLATW